MRRSLLPLLATVALALIVVAVSGLGAYYLRLRSQSQQTAVQPDAVYVPQVVTGENTSSQVIEVASGSLDEALQQVIARDGLRPVRMGGEPDPTVVT